MAANPLCAYTGVDTTAVVGSNDDGTYFSRCNCGTVTLQSGTNEEAVAALAAHRDESS